MPQSVGVPRSVGVSRSVGELEARFSDRGHDVPDDWFPDWFPVELAPSVEPPFQVSRFRVIAEGLCSDCA